MRMQTVSVVVLLWAAWYPDLHSQPIRAYFGPDENHTIERVVLSELKQARDSVLVQAYGFTSFEIAGLLDSLKDSHSRVVIGILLDKSNRYSSTSMASWLQRQKVDIWIDNTVPIAHNKVIIIDGKTVLTGSYNWTEHSKLNAENFLVIKDAAVVADYCRNWHKRQAMSRRIFKRAPSLQGAAPTKMYRRRR